MHTRALGVVFATVLAVAPAAARPPEIVVRSGVRAGDGLALATLTEPYAHGRTILFGATTSALFAGHTGALVTLARTGDPLPPPLAGTWNAALRVVVNRAGDVLAAATLDGSATEQALFLFAGESVEVIAAGNPGRPVLDDRGDVAYVLDQSTLYRWRRETGPVALASLDGTAPDGGAFGALASRIALDPTGRIAFIAGGRVFVADADGTVVRLAAPGDPVGSTTIRHILTTYLTIDEQGGVVFRASLRRGGGEYVRAAGGTLTTTRPTARPPSPSLTATDDTPLGRGFSIAAGGGSPTGAFAVAGERQGVYGLVGRIPQPLVTTADPAFAAGDSFRAFAVARRRLVLQIAETMGDGLAVLGRNGRLRHVLGVGDPSPVSGVAFTSIGGPLLVVGNDVLFTGGLANDGAGIFRLDPSTGVSRTVVVLGAAAPDGHAITGFEPFAPAGRDVAFAATLDDGATAVLLAGRHGLRTLLTTRAGGPGSALGFGGFGGLAVVAHHVLFAASGAPGAGVFLARGPRVEPIAVGGSAAPGGGTFSELTAQNGTPVSLAASGRSAAFIATVTVTQDRSVTGVFALRGTKPRHLFDDGSPLDGGSVILDGTLAVTPRGVVVGTSFTGGSIRSALLRLRP